MSSLLRSNDENNNAIVLYFVNKKNPNRPIMCKLGESTTIFDVKKHLLSFFGKNIRNRISGFRLVREGTPEDDIEDTIPNNYFDDEYNDMKIGEFKKLIEESHIYKNDDKSGKPLIYFRSIITNNELDG